MSLSSTTRRMDYTGNGAVDTYAYSFRIFEDEDLYVVVRDTDNVETVLDLTTDYTVTGAGSASGGNVVLVNSAQDWLDVDGDLLSGYHLTIRRVRELKQNTDIRNQGDFFPETHEDSFDHFVMIDQQQQDEIDRSVKLPDSISDADFDPTLPADILDYPGTCPALNDTGDGFADASTWPTIAEIQNASDAAAAVAAAATALNSWLVGSDPIEITEGQAATIIDDDLAILDGDEVTSAHFIVEIYRTSLVRNLMHLFVTADGDVEHGEELGETPSNVVFTSTVVGNVATLNVECVGGADGLGDGYIRLKRVAYAAI